MLFFDQQYTLKHCARPRVSVAKVANQLAIMIDSDSFGDEILLDHLDQVVRVPVLRRRARRQASGVKIRLASELIDTLGDRYRD
jgi:hypothetical protein